ncbi:MAG: hypothetical protein J6U93_06070 [Alistipes sp.]|nr:hypothetical protein [Alistipes sp.]
MKRIYISALVALFAGLISTSNVKAQVLDFGGTVLNNDIATWMDLYDLSFTSHNYGTARSMAMGNAFTALGADMVSASLNPAGVAMYVGGDLSFTPMVTVAKSNTSGEAFYANGSDGYFSNRATRFVVPNFGVVVPVSMSTGLLTNINFAVSYNRIADFNQNRLMASRGNSADNSLANYFCEMSNADDHNFKFNSDGRLEFGDPFYWGAVLAYKNGLTNRDDNGWFIDRIGADAIIDQYSSLETRGAVDEWSFAGGFNLVDKVYLGISIGIQSIDYTRDTYYGEDYLYDGGDSGLEHQLMYTNYMQTTRYYGTGHNFKFGVTARPLHWLRVGVAYHTPTYYSLETYYAGEMWTQTSYINPTTEKEQIIDDYVQSPVFEEYGINSWRYRTPSRLLTGVAVTLGNRAILSADYERSWYQTLRLQESTIVGLDDVYKSYFKDVFKANNTLRLGVECYLLPAMALRAGYIWSNSAIKEDYTLAITSRPIATSQTFATAGLGLHLNKTTYLDFAYQYGTTHYTSMQPFYVTETYDGVTTATIESAIFDTKTKRHNIVVTLGVRF